MTVAQLREVLANLPDDMQIGISYDGMETGEFKPYISVEDENGEEINESEATSSDFLVFVLD